MQMSLEQYILNPALKSNAILNAATRELIKANYQKKFDNIMLRENGKVTYYLYSESKENVYWAYIKVPSEICHNFYYDVIFKFTPTNNTGFFEDLFKFNVQFFSNDPNFVFTYAYVFHQNELFINELRSKMSKEIGYEKAIYFAYLIMKERKLNKSTRFKAEAKPLDVKFILTNVMHADEKIRDRQEEGKKYSKKKEAVINKNVYDRMMSNLDRKTRKSIDMSKSNIKVVSTTKKIGSIKRASGIKTTKISPKK